jgi:hypothetical protein
MMTEFRVETSCHISKTISELVVIVNVYIYVVFATPLGMFHVHFTLMLVNILTQVVPSIDTVSNLDNT